MFRIYLNLFLLKCGAATFTKKKSETSEANPPAKYAVCKPPAESAIQPPATKPMPIPISQLVM